mmetsp:Transcript_23247/g.60586  ORF Transcript_23247/g.60586 Transcript_23247/m.60586 type:complete len:105 (-) Transcript_23247:159-473(-)
MLQCLLENPGHGTCAGMGKKLHLHSSFQRNWQRPLLYCSYNFLPLLSFLADQSSCDCLNVEALELGRLLLAVENEEGMGAGALAGLLDEAQGGNECGLAPSMGL